MAQKTSLVCVLHAGRSMERHLPVARALVSCFATQKMMASKTFELALVSYGGPVTANHLNEEDAEQYVGVEEVAPLKPLSAEFLQAVRRVECGAGDGDLIDGVVVGYDLLKRIGRFKCNRLLLLVTDGAGEVAGVEDLEAVVNEMILDAGEIKYAKLDDERVKNCIVLVALLAPPGATGAVGENAKLLRNVAQATGGAFVQGETLEALLPVFDFRGMGTRPQAKSIQLELSPSVQVPCVTWNLISTARLPSLKKEAQSFDPSDPESGTVKRDTSYLVPSLDDQETAYEDRVKGYKYGAAYVPVSGGEDVFEVAGAMGIRLIGFLPASRVRRHHFMDAPVVLQGARGLASESAVVALARALRASVSVALARYTKKDNADVALVALLPASADDGTLLMVRLPCVEDVRDAAFPSLQTRGGRATKEQRQSVSNLVDALTVGADSVPPPLDAGSVNFYLELERRAVGAEQSLYRCGSAPPRSSSLASAEDAVRAAFPLVVIEAKQTRQKKYWSDITMASEGEASTAGPADAPAPSAEEPRTLNVATVTPAEDFASLVDRLGSSTALQLNAHLLEEIVDYLITAGATAAYFRKAVACLQAYRAAAVSAQDCGRFNGYLRGVKQSYAGGPSDKLWLEVKKHRVSLISSVEVSTSPVSAAESEAFLESAVEVPMETTVKAEAADAVEEFFDDME